MKNTSVFSRVPLITVCLTTFVTAQTPSEAVLGITAASAQTLSIHITDHGNYTWRLQSSPDLSTWTDVQVIKVHNGLLDREVTPAAGLPGLFYARPTPPQTLWCPARWRVRCSSRPLRIIMRIPRYLRASS